MANGGSPPLTVVDRRRWAMVHRCKYEVQTDMSVRGMRWQAEVLVRVRGGVCQYEVRVRESMPIIGNNEAVGRRQKDQNTLRSSNMSGG
ncbi:hypothetical protein Tco_1494792 [Tanacetum coccineum]